MAIFLLMSVLADRGCSRCMLNGSTDMYTLLPYHRGKFDMHPHEKDLHLLPKQPSCWIFLNATMPELSVAADSRHISAYSVANTTGLEILLTFEDSVQHINILHVAWLNSTTAKNGTGTGWRWTNMTRKLENVVQLGSIGDDWDATRLAGTC